MEQLSAAEATALRAAAELLEVSSMSVQRAQKKAIASLRQRLEGS